MTLHRLNLNMIPGGATPEIHLSELDSDFRFVFPLSVSSGALRLEDNTTADFIGTLPDGTAVTAPATLDPVEPSVTVDGSFLFTSVPGTALFAVRLIHGAKFVCSPCIALIIEPSPA